MSAVLVDTSVWVDHFRQGSAGLVALLAAGQVLVHPSVLGEIACGTPPDRAETLADLGRLQLPQQASIREALVLIEREQLWGQGCAWVNVLLLASTLMTPGALLWTLDKRLQALAERFGVAHSPALH